jgi:hypothetical protein
MTIKNNKILPEKMDKFEYSKQVTAKFCSILSEGKITIEDQLITIETFCNIMHPKTISQYRDNKLNHYSSVKDAVQNKRLMTFKIGDVIFIPKQ